MNMEEIYSDDALVEQIRLGDEKAAEELIRRYYTSVLRYCKRQCFNLENMDKICSTIMTESSMIASSSKISFYMYK